MRLALLSGGKTTQGLFSPFARNRLSGTIQLDDNADLRTSESESIRVQ